MPYHSPNAPLIAGTGRSPWAARQRGERAEQPPETMLSDHSFRVAIQPPMITSTPIDIHTQGNPRVSHVKPTPAAIVAIEAIFALREIARRSRQSLICGPHVGCSTIRRSHSGLLRAKQKAASRRKGTVGTMGRMAPIAPRTVNNTPAAR